jgi:hypothetical protein
MKFFSSVTFRMLRHVFPITMTKRIVFVFALIMTLALVALAADITGKWVAQVPGRNGQTRETVFNFKVSGETLTGTMTGRQGEEIPISDGKITGDTLSFTVTREFGGNTMKLNYTGKVVDDEIQMKRESSRGGPREFVAKRAK